VCGSRYNTTKIYIWTILVYVVISTTNHHIIIFSGMDGHYLHFMDWVERYRRMRVLGNISNVIEAQEFLEQNIDGIGACYMENMLIGSTDRLNILRCLFLANTEDEQNIYLHKIRQILTQDFEKVYLLIALV
jgi:hypothetical protein